VSYQRAIEEVYWRHRIWPKERPDPKPSLDAVISQAQLEKKVESYLRNSQALEDYWQRPITSQQLQVEMDRMAKYSKQPDVLRELFEVLGSDPFVIAECLARPVLTERLVADFSTQHITRRFGPVRTKALCAISMAATLPSAAYTVPKISEGDSPCTDNSWTATTITNAPTGRINSAAVWTGSEMIVWGGTDESNEFNTGGRYNPSTDSWTATSTTNAPTGRELNTVVWTGTEMIVWGGADATSFLNTGGRYNPNTDGWIATNTTNAPSARYSHTAVWTGSEMVVWGGNFYDGSYHYLNTGGRYNPSTDSWTATSTTNAPLGRYLHTAIWTSTEMIIWGGANVSSFNTGGRYNPSTDSWTATSTTNAPTARELHTALWTGSEMVIWGGSAAGPSLNTGSRYDPGTDSWIATSTTNAPSSRYHHAAVWTGSEMIVWAGFQFEPPLPGTFVNTGGRYDLSADSWTATSTINVPTARSYPLAVWSGNQMVVWSGDDLAGNYLSTGGRYCAQSGPSATPTPTPTPPPCTGRCGPTPRPRLTPLPRPTPP